MTVTARRPEPGVTGTVADAARGNWVDTRAPAWTRPCLRLSRADRPVGTWLLYIPCLWGALLAAAASGRFGWYDLWIVAGCGVGAWLMRGAGCTWNDITDRDYDAAVSRTRSRPLPSGQITVRGALVWMCVQAVAAFAILLTFPLPAILLGIASLILVAIYPFAKRFTWWPQVFLGLAFNWGALLAWTAVTGTLGLPAVMLYAAGIAWTLFYDTIYAHQDREDDALIGVKSTARLFGSRTGYWLLRFQTVTVIAQSAAVLLALSPQGSAAVAIGLAGAAAMALHLGWQHRRLDIDDPANCLLLFRANRDSGLIFAGALGVACLV